MSSAYLTDEDIRSSEAMVNLAITRLGVMAEAVFTMALVAIIYGSGLRQRRKWGYHCNDDANDDDVRMMQIIRMQMLRQTQMMRAERITLTRWHRHRDDGPAEWPDNEIVWREKFIQGASSRIYFLMKNQSLARDS